LLQIICVQVSVLCLNVYTYASEYEHIPSQGHSASFTSTRTYRIARLVALIIHRLPAGRHRLDHGRYSTSHIAEAYELHPHEPSHAYVAQE